MNIFTECCSCCWQLKTWLKSKFIHQTVVATHPLVPLSANSAELQKTKLKIRPQFEICHISTGENFCSGDVEECWLKRRVRTG